jgi:hypothetical protein
MNASANHLGKSGSTAESGVKPESSQPHPLAPIRATSVKTFGVIWIVSLLLCFPVYALICPLWVTHYRSADAAWIDSLYRQKEVLLDRRAAQGGRLIIVGGSNALFGIDAELIERKLHIPTVNFGTHAGLGLSYMLYRVGKKMQRGDIILLDPEYDLWTDLFRDTPGPAFSYIWTYDKPYLAHLPIRERLGMIASVPVGDWKADGWTGTARTTVQYDNLKKTSGYNVASMDPSGDLRCVVGFHPVKTSGYYFVENFNASGYVALRGFAAEAKSRGVRLLMTWPNYLRPSPEPTRESSMPPAGFAEQMAASGVTVLNNPADTAFPPSWFMDSAYHANPCCRRVRTEQLIERLRPQLGLPGAAEKVTGIFLVAGIRHQLTDGNLFADDPGVRFRYLREEDPGNLPAVTAAQLAELVRQGMPVYTDSPDAEALLARAGLTQELWATGKISIANWFARYPSHIFCLAAPPNHPFDPVWKSVVPDAVYRQLHMDKQACAMVFGSGRYAGFDTIVLDASRARVADDLPRLFQQPSMFACHVEVEACANDGGVPSAKIRVNWGDFLKGGKGISISVIDPEIASVIETVTFEGGPDLQTWRLFRVVAANPATRS